jgi:hypothetical protein
MLFLAGILLVSGQQVTPKMQTQAVGGQQLKVVEGPDVIQSNKLVQTGGNILEVPLGEPGSMYLDDEFFPGNLVLKDNTTMDNLPLRYNIYFQQMQFIQGTDTLAFKNPSELKSLRFNGRTFIYLPFDNDGVIDSSYFELMGDGYCKMLMRRKVEYHEIIDRKNCDQSMTYVKTASPYLQKQGEPAKKCIKTSKGVCTFFADEKEEITKFIEVNDLNMKKCEDIKEVVAFYNVLKR